MVVDVAGGVGVAEDHDALTLIRRARSCEVLQVQGVPLSQHPRVAIITITGSTGV